MCGGVRCECIQLYNIYSCIAYAAPALEEDAGAGGERADKRQDKPLSETADVAYFSFYKFRTSTDIN